MTTAPRLPGRRLQLARGLWLLLAAPSLALVLLLIPINLRVGATAWHITASYPAVANYFKDPLPLERGEMQHVWDVEGKRYLDFFGGIVTVGVGHCNPRVTTAQKAQIDKLGHTSTLYPHETMAALAEKIAHITPGRLEKSFFTSKISIFIFHTQYNI